jgi:hypothetical protein
LGILEIYLHVAPIIAIVEKKARWVTILLLCLPTERRAIGLENDGK